MSHLPQFTISKAPRPTKHLAICRSCTNAIAVGVVRMQIAYPTKLLVFKLRTVTPSFFLHFNCFLSAPVKYVQEGPDAWKKWEPCDVPYAVDVKGLKGLEKFSNDERKEIEGKLEKLNDVPKISSRVE